VGLIRDCIDPAGRWDNLHASQAAGLSRLGTQAAGEFLTNRAAFEQAVAGAPAGWPARNMQLVLRAEVIGKTPGPPKVLARYFW
jgi:hypothetical protein